MGIPIAGKLESITLRPRLTPNTPLPIERMRRIAIISGGILLGVTLLGAAFWFGLSFNRSDTQQQTSEWNGQVTTPGKRTLDQQRAYDMATLVIDEALNSGQWTNEFQQRMLKLKSRLDGPDDLSLRSRLMAAGNAGKLIDKSTQPFFF